MTESKKNKIIISILVLIVLILVGAVALLMSVKNDVDNSFFFKIKKPTSNIESQQNNSEVNQKENTENEMVLNKNEFANTECLDGWQGYKQDVLGISFCYPKDKWGEARVDFIENLTDLNKLPVNFSTPGNGMHDNIKIIFGDDRQSMYKERIRIQLLNDDYRQEYYALRGEESGYQDNLQTLKNTKDICNYKVGWAEDGAKGYGKELYSQCDRNVKIFITEKGRKFETSGLLYQYFLEMVAYKKMQNGYFDNAFIRYDVDSISQIKKPIKNFDTFFNFDHSYENGKRITLDKQKFVEYKEDFQKFVNSIKTYKPIKKDLQEFKSSVDTDDKNIKLIENYYWLLTKKDFKGAYNLKRLEKVFGDFMEDYQNIYYAKPYSFRNLGDGDYDFLVEYQDHNKPVQTFHIKMKVSNGKLKTNFVEEFKSKKVKFGDNVTYVTIRGDKTYVILEKDGREIVVDEGKSKYDKKKTNIGEVKFFRGVKFSSQGKYLIYGMTGWEWGFSYVYDVNKERRVMEKEGKLEFTPDEKYLFHCASAGMGGYRAGVVYDVSNNWKEVYNVFGRAIGNEKYEKNNEYIGVDCKYNSDKRAVQFVLDGFQDGKNLSVKKMEYQLP